MKKAVSILVLILFTLTTSVITGCESCNRKEPVEAGVEEGVEETEEALEKGAEEVEEAVEEGAEEVEDIGDDN